MGDAGDVESAGGHVRCHEEPDLAAAHVHDGAVPGILVHVSVKGRRRMSLGRQLAGKLVGVPLGAGKDDRPGHGAVGNKVAQYPVLVLHVVGGMEALLDRFKGGLLPGDLYPHRVLEQTLGKLCHGAVHGCREHQRLARGRRRRGNGVHCLAETHVEHAVGFIKDQYLKTGKIDASPLHMVHEPSRRCHDKVHGLRQEPLLLEVGHAAEDGAAPYAHELSIGAHGRGHLVRQFARGRKHQHAGAFGPPR